MQNTQDPYLVLFLKKSRKTFKHYCFWPKGKKCQFWSLFIVFSFLSETILRKELLFFCVAFSASTHFFWAIQKLVFVQFFKSSPKGVLGGVKKLHNMEVGKKKLEIRGQKGTRKRLVVHRMPLYFIPVSVSLGVARTLLKRLLSKNLDFNTRFTHASRRPGA